MGVYEKLTLVQAELKAPKSKKNTFGGYNYRSLEDICEAAKPLLKAHKCALFLEDDMQALGDRFYLVATARFVDIETGEAVTTKAMAREAELKKGMDESQITGTASSYARKYCLNALFLIDDTKDADTDEYVKQIAGEPEKKAEAPKKSEPKPVSSEDKKLLFEMIQSKGLDYKQILAEAGWHEGEKITMAQYKAVLKKLEA